MWKNTLWYEGQLAPCNPSIQMYNVISSVLIKHQPCILLFWTLFDTCSYCYRHISLYVSSFISLVFWENDVVFRPFFWKNNMLFTYNFLEKSGKWKLGVHYEPWWNASQSNLLLYGVAQIHHHFEHLFILKQ